MSKIAALICAVLLAVAFIFGAVFGEFLAAHRQSILKPTCEQVALEIKALEICLKYRPTCDAITVEKFVKYYQNKDWMQLHCTKGDDGSQS